MRRRAIDRYAHTTADPDIVFALLAEGATWPDWSPIEAFELERTGDPPPEGVGAIRVFRKGRTVGRDQIVALDPGRTYGYVSLSGVPVRDYRGDVTLTPANGGTDIHWHTSFFPKTFGTGWILERGLGRFIEDCTNGLAAQAAANVGTGGSAAETSDHRPQHHSPGP